MRLAKRVSAVGTTKAPTRCSSTCRSFGHDSGDGRSHDIIEFTLVGEGPAAEEDPDLVVVSAQSRQRRGAGELESHHIALDLDARGRSEQLARDLGQRFRRDDHVSRRGHGDPEERVVHRQMRVRVALDQPGVALERSREVTVVEDQVVDVVEQPDAQPPGIKCQHQNIAEGRKPEDDGVAGKAQLLVDFGGAGAAEIDRHRVVSGHAQEFDLLLDAVEPALRQVLRADHQDARGPGALAAHRRGRGGKMLNFLQAAQHGQAVLEDLGALLAPAGEVAAVGPLLGAADHCVVEAP